MCGILAIYNRHGEIDAAALEAAAKRLEHRGPDGRQCWLSPDKKVGLGHTRLSIIDLETGDQPIVSEDEKTRIIVNGELYDYQQIRENLIKRGHRFRTSSDSEIALHLYEDLGVGCLEYLRGEFALALWDQANETLFAARDRFGIKPLFYAVVGETVYLASEIKALLAAGIPARWDKEAFYQQLFVSLDAERTLFSGFYQVPPGHYLLATRGTLRVVRYWELDYPRSDQPTPEVVDDNALIEELRHHLHEAVRIRLRADVPVGCFLSGGVDSSAILGIASEYSRESLRAFTVTFDQSGYDEGLIAKETAAFVGADFSPIHLKHENFADDLEDAVWHAEMLGVNPHGVARYLQSRAVREAGYKVVLSGEGSDEIFAGYNHARQDLQFADASAYLYLKEQDSANENGTAEKIPQSLEIIRQTLGFVPTWLKKLAVSRSAFHLLLAKDYGATFAQRNPFKVFLNGIDVAGQMAGRETVLQSLYLWAKSVLPNYILFAERLEMAHPVEVRLPFLDHHLFEFVRKLPVSLLIHDRKEKYALREAARPHLTDTIYSRPKQPFTAPPATLTTDNRLYSLMQDSLRSETMSSVPFFDQKIVIKLLDQLPKMDNSKRMALDPVLMMVLCTYFLHKRFNL